MELFKSRWMYEFENNKKTWKSVVDLTVLLYMVIPMIAFLVFLYRDYYQHVNEYWIAKIPLYIILPLFLVITTMKKVRTYIQEADLLFFIQQQSKYYHFKLLGFIWSLMRQVILTFAMLALFYPLLAHIHKMNWISIAALFFCTIFYSLINSLAYISIASNWLLLLFRLILVVGTTASLINLRIETVLFISLVGTTFVIYAYSKKVLHTTKYFVKELNYEREQYYKWISLVFMVSPELRSEAPPKMKRPKFLWTESQRVFKKNPKENAVEEILLKTLLRNAKYKWDYLRLMGLAISLLIILPFWFKWGLLICLFFGLKSWLNAVYIQISAHAIFKVFLVRKELVMKARGNITKWLVNYPISVMAVGLLIFTFFSL